MLCNFNVIQKRLKSLDLSFGIGIIIWYLLNVYLNHAVKLFVQKAPQDPIEITSFNLKKPLAS